MFQTVVADPPWPFEDRLPGPGRGAAKNYSTMTMGDIQSFPMPELAPDCRLFLWVVAAMPQEALWVLNKWGFVPKAEIIWLKETAKGKPWFGMGRTVRGAHERCIVATKGRPPVLSHSVRSVFSAKVGAHSEKPQEFFDIIEKLSPGPYLELFARRQHAGWTCMGDELEC